MNKLTKEELDFINTALNKQWNRCTLDLEKKDIGIIFRQITEQQKTKVMI